MRNQRFWFRLITLLIGGVLLIWLLIEESSTLGVLLFSAGTCAWGLIYFSFGQHEQGRLTFIRSTLIGLINGLIVSPFAILLMALKSGLHGHTPPDFTPDQVEFALSRFPVFALGGMITGAADWFWLRVRFRKPCAG